MGAFRGHEKGDAGVASVVREFRIPFIHQACREAKAQTVLSHGKPMSTKAGLIWKWNYSSITAEV